MLCVPGARAHIRVQTLWLPILLQLHSKAQHVLYVLGAEGAGTRTTGGGEGRRVPGGRPPSARRRAAHRQLRGKTGLHDVKSWHVTAQEHVTGAMLFRSVDAESAVMLDTRVDVQ